MYLDHKINLDEKIMFGSDWDIIMDYIIQYWNLFIAWFQSLAIPAQALVGLFLLFGVMAIAYTIYGAFWIAIQSIKFSILIAVVSVYLTFVLLGLPLVAISGPKNIPRYWNRSEENIKWFVSRMYPVKSDGKAVETVTYTTQHQPTAAQNAPVVIIKEPKPVVESNTQVSVQPEPQVYYKEPEPEVEEVPQYIESNPAVQSEVNESFCPHCGASFSDRMKYVLLDKRFTFCEDCGTKIYRRN